jgi:hypothetical protein
MELFEKHVRTWELFCLAPPSPPRQKKLHGKSTVQVESEHWTVHSPTQLQLEENIPAPTPTPTRKKKGGPFIPCASHWLHGNYIPKIGLPLFFA